MTGSSRKGGAGGIGAGRAAGGTGLAPFMSLIRDPEVYERFEHVILVHGCRLRAELAYDEVIRTELPDNEFFGEQVASAAVLNGQMVEPREVLFEIVDPQRMLVEASVPDASLARRIGSARMTVITASSTSRIGSMSEGVNVGLPEDVSS